MKHRIRAAGLLIDHARILLVCETDQTTGIEYWVPPGGGLEPEDGSVIACVRRELREETGLEVEVGSLVYVREFVEATRETHYLELFFEIRSYLKAAGLRETDRRARWFTKDQLARLNVAPEEIKHDIWKHWLPERALTKYPKYLGVHFADIA